MAMEWRWEGSSQRFHVNKNSQSERSKEAVHTVGNNGCTWKLWVAWSSCLDPAHRAESQTNWPNNRPVGPPTSLPFVPYSLPETYYFYLAIRFLLFCFVFEGGEFLVAQVVKNLPANAGDASSIPGSEKSPREGKSYPLQYSCLENLMDREA